VLFAGLFSWQLDARIMRRIVGQPQFAGVMLTIAIAFMLRGLVSMSFGPESRTYPTPWSGQTTRLAGLVVNDLSLAIVAAALLITLALFWFLKKTALGISIQAASQNQLAAYLSGIRVKRVTSMVWAISGAIAAVCGLLLETDPRTGLATLIEPVRIGGLGPQAVERLGQARVLALLGELRGAGQPVGARRGVERAGPVRVGCGDLLLVFCLPGHADLQRAADVSTAGPLVKRD
jgi:hypothetical protein